MKKLIRNIIMRLSYYFMRVFGRVSKYIRLSAYQRKQYEFGQIGKGAHIEPKIFIYGGKYITIGDNFEALKGLRIEAIDSYAGDHFSPSITIGDNVVFNPDCHIGAIDKIVIGNNVLFASKVYVSDHFHGQINSEELDISPIVRPLTSKGPVVIEDNVWIGEGVAILPGVTIGFGAIIGANSVVTRDVPARSVVAGVPAKVIKQL